MATSTDGDRIAAIDERMGTCPMVIGSSIVAITSAAVLCTLSPTTEPLAYPNRFDTDRSRMQCWVHSYDIATNKTILLFSNASSSSSRQNLLLRFGDDGGIHWSNGVKVYPSNAAYSSLTILKAGEIGILYERNDYTEVIFTSVPFAQVYSGR